MDESFRFFSNFISLSAEISFKFILNLVWVFELIDCKSILMPNLPMGLPEISRDSKVWV